MSAFRRIALLASLAVFAASCSEAPIERPNIIVFTLDTTRADVFGCYGASPSATPFADELAKESVRFTNCFAVRGLTHPSLSSMLTGKYPATHGLRLNGDKLSREHATLAEILKDAGYRTAAFVSSIDRSRWPFWTRGFEFTADGTQQKLVEESNRPDGQWGWDQRVTAGAIRYVESLPKDGRPLFLWVHLFDAHAPYTPNPEDARAFLDPKYDGELRDGDTANFEIRDAISDYALDRKALREADLEFARSMYRASVHGCDARVRKIANALEKAGLWQNALRVLTADHGEDLGEHHRYFGHGNSIYDSTLHIPLLLSGPPVGAAGKTVDALTQNLDLFPTILTAAKLEVPVDCEGNDLAPLWRDPAAKGRDVVIAEIEDEITSASDGKWKLIANPGGFQPQDMPFALTSNRGFPYQCFELYDLARDPREQVNLYAKSHPEAKRLTQVIQQFLALPQHRIRGESTVAEDAAALNALGYTAGSSKNGPRIECEER